MLQIALLTSLTDQEFDSETVEQDNATALDNSGTIVGYSLNDAVEWKNGTPSILWTGGVANGINASGEVVGFQLDQTGGEHAVALINGSLTTLSVAGLSSAYSASYAVNDGGLIIGALLSSSGANPLGAVIWQNGQALYLGDGTTVNGLNDAGQVVGEDAGYHPFMWEGGKMTALSTLSALPYAIPLAINSQGVIVGGALSSPGFQTQTAVIWQNGQITALPTLPGDTYTFAAAINDAGISVGQAKIQGVAGSQRAVMWVDGQITDLNSLLPANSGWKLYYANAINNNNEIVGYGEINGVGADFTLTLGSGGGTAQIGASAEVVTTQMPSATLAVIDSASDITHYLDALQGVAAAGHLGSITLTDGGTPDLAVTAAQFTADAAVLSDIFSAHAVTVQVNGNAAQHNFSADHWSGASALQFADQTVIVAATPGPASAVTTGNVTELYSAVLAREPDVGGLAYYQNYLKANPGTPLLTFAEFFLSSSEYTSAHNYAQTTAGDTQFIQDSYQNLLHRAASPDDVTFYLTKVLEQPGSQLQNHAQMLVYFSASAEFLSDVQITAANPASAQHWLLLT